MLFLPLVIILDKVEGFKIEDKVGKKLKKEIFQSGKTKKDWLTSQVDGLDNLRKVRNEPDERWVAIPARELDDLHSNYPTHYNFIYDRILEHCLQQNLEVTFDNLLLDCLYFFNYNIMEYFRNKDGKFEVLIINHGVGISYSKFLDKLIRKFLNKTKQYDFESSHVSENTISLKLKKLTS